MIMRWAKYHNSKIVVPDGKFDSRRELSRWTELKLMEKAGEISFLKRQVPYTLIPSQKTEEGTLRPVKYIADFVYEKDGQTVVEDAKGMKTKDYVIKNKMMYFFHGILIKEV